MKLSDEQKRFAKSIALYSLLYPVMMLVTHRIRTGGLLTGMTFWTQS